MKYAMLIFESNEETEQPSEAEREFATLARWWANLKAEGTIIASARLASTRPVTSVSWPNTQPILTAMMTDGPYLEAKESVAGFALLDVPGYDEAMQIVASLPPAARSGMRIELRRVVER
jgi:hypothetical protein